MVVDDNQHMRKLIAAMLQAFGASYIHEASDGQHAWSMMSDINPDIILLD